MNDQPSKRGGKRPGAGRPPAGDAKRVSRSITLPRQSWEAIDKKAEQQSCSASEIVHRWAKRLR